MDLVEDLLVVGIGVNRGHQPALDPDSVVQHLGEGRQAVGGARSVGNDGVTRFELVVVDAVNDGQIDVLAGGRDQHLLGTGGEVLFAACAVGEEAGAFQRDVDAVRGMRQVGRIALGRNVDALAVDDQIVAIDFDRAAKGTVNTVTLEQHGIGLGRSQIVDRDQFEVMIGARKDRPRHIAPDAPETVDRNLDRHERNSCLFSPAGP